MHNGNELKKLLRRKKAFVKGINVMITKLFDIDNEITNLLVKEIELVSKNDSKASDLLTQKEVCVKLKISPSTLYRLRVQNEFPFVKIEGKKNVMYSLKDIEDYYYKNKIQ